jgi:uncharacterized membrane protein
MQRRRPGQDAPSSQRLVSFSDGVIAIAMTLLAFQLRVPVIKDASSASELSHALGQHLPGYRLYLIAFVLIGFFWMVHHRVFRVIEGHDAFLAWANMLFLLGISVMPFAANLFTVYSNNLTAMMVYGGVFTLISLSFLTISFVAEWRGLMQESADRAVLRAGRRRSFATTAVFGISVAVAPIVGAGDAELIWVAIPVALLVLRRLRPAPGTGA